MTEKVVTIDDIPEHIQQVVIDAEEAKANEKKAQTIASVEDFRPKGERITLPDSGLTVLVQRPDVIGLIKNSKNGDAPDPLSSFIMANINGKANELTAKDLPSMMESAELVVKAAFLQPKVGDEEDKENGIIPLSWLTYIDKMYVFGWAMNAGGQLPAMQSFPTQPSGNMEAL